MAHSHARPVRPLVFCLVLALERAPRRRQVRLVLCLLRMHQVSSKSGRIRKVGYDHHCNKLAMLAYLFNCVFIN